MTTTTKSKAGERTQGISFKASKEEFKTIGKIARRAVALAVTHDIEYDYLTADMDISACHANGTPLDLDKLLAADDFNFAHDVFGIRRHIDRDTGEIMDCFVPRCARSNNSVHGE